MIVVDGVEMVDVQEAARLARRTPETIRRWVWSGRVTSVRQGNKLFLPKAEVEATGTTVAGGEQEPDLVSWLAMAERANRGVPGRTASDLVLDDRASRADR